MGVSTSNPISAGYCFNCGGQLYIGLTHGCSSGSRSLAFTPVAQPVPPNELYFTYLQRR